MGELIDLEDRRRWKRAKEAWARHQVRTPWSALTEEQRLQFRRDFEAAERRLRERYEGR